MYRNDGDQELTYSPQRFNKAAAATSFGSLDSLRS
jgi:hypothetical protein